MTKIIKDKGNVKRIIYIYVYKEMLTESMNIIS